VVPQAPTANRRKKKKKKRKYISVRRESSAVMLRRPALLMSAPSRYGRNHNSLPHKYVQHGL
jgi:hypothetical protein